MTVVEDLSHILEKANGMLRAGPYQLFYIPESDNSDEWGYYVTNYQTGATLFRSKLYIVSALMRMVWLCENLDNNID